MANRLSYSKVSTYTTCGHKYKLQYIDGYREKHLNSALAFGTAIDIALNSLLMERDLQKAMSEFNKSWAFQYVGSQMTSLSDCPLIMYGNADYDADLLKEEDLAKINLTDYERLVALKQEKGWDNFALEERKHYNFVNWLCLRRKGEIMLASYAKEVLPKIKRTLVVQHKFELSNSEEGEAGDIVSGVVDAIVELNDGRIALIDNKTSAREYTQESAARSQQLILYFHTLKEEFNLSCVGYFVMLKAIRKNKVKICSKCAHDGSGSRSKTCDIESEGVVIKRGKETTGMVRCEGEWLLHVNPTCYIQTVISDVSETAQDLVLSSFDEANTAIKQGNFYKNLNACSSPFPCQFYKICWNGDFSDVTQKVPNV